MKHIINLRYLKRRLLLITIALSFPMGIAASGSVAMAHGWHGNDNGNWWNNWKNRQNFSLQGDAQLVRKHNQHKNIVKLRSDEDPGFGAVSFKLKHDKTFADLTHLSGDYKIKDGDGCGDGSPRFKLKTDEGNIYVYIGPSPDFMNCDPGWQNTGELIGNNDACRFNTSELGGDACSTYDDVLANFGDLQINKIKLIVDGGDSEEASGGDGRQVVLADNVVINNKLYTFDNHRHHHHHHHHDNWWKDNENEDSFWHNN